jgi:hypothetical protein
MAEILEEMEVEVLEVKVAKYYQPKTEEKPEQIVAYDTVICDVSLAVVSPCKCFLMHVIWRDDESTA